MSNRSSDYVPLDENYHLRCPNCGGSASLPMGLTCSDHKPVPVTSHVPIDPAGESLFPELEPVQCPEPEPVEKLSPDRRRTLRQRADVARGRHPLTGSRLTGDTAANCGNCRFRQVFSYHNRSYGKCVWLPASTDARDVESPRFMPPRVSHSAASDVRAWWPGCTDHEWGDPKVGPDAMRVPGVDLP